MRLVITNNLHNEFARVLESTSKDMLEYSKAIVPVESGELKNSIETVVENNTITLSANTDYALFVEMGSKKHNPEPFLRPSMNRAFTFMQYYFKQVLT